MVKRVGEEKEAGWGWGGLGREDDLRLWEAHWIDYHRPYWMPYTSPLIYPNLLILSQKFSTVVAHILDEFCTCIFPCFSVFGYWYTCPRDANLQRTLYFALHPPWMSTAPPAPPPSSPPPSSPPSPPPHTPTNWPSRQIITWEWLRALYEVLHELHTLKIHYCHCNDKIIFVRD